ncbi:MAG: hypothetical protein RJA22_1209 [Verrucomicrobiota bacterium]
MPRLLSSGTGRLGGLVGAILTLATGWVLLNLNLHFSRSMVHLSYDLPFLFRPVVIPDEVRMVYLNDDAHRALGQPYDAAWDRGIHARLVERLTEAGARAVVFDIVFSGPSANPEADARLARALKANGRVILASEYTPFAFGAGEGYRVERPHEPLAEAAAGLGITQLAQDEDLEVRRHYHGPMQEPVPIYSEAWAAARVAGLPVARDDSARAAHRWMNYYCPPGLLPATAIHQALQPDGVPPGFFSNKVVFVGSYLSTAFSGERKDEFTSPFTAAIKGGEQGVTRKTHLAGVDVHATMFLNLLRGDWLRRSPAAVELLGLVGVGVIFGWGLARLRPLIAVAAAALAMGGVAALGYASFTRWHYWFPWVPVVAQIFVAMNWAVIFNSIQLFVQKRLLEQTLGRYVSTKLVKRLAGDPDALRKFTRPGARKQVVTVLFTDIAGFTGLSEHMDSDDLARQMNRYFESAVSRCIFPEDGTVVKYIGDSILALWNAPDDQPDHALRACRAALSFRNQPPLLLNGRRLETRLGLHTGEANVGNFGSRERVDYTALGRNVNLASRLEGLNKQLGTTLLASAETYALVRDRIVGRPCGVFQLLGFEETVQACELIDPIEVAESSRAWREAFAAALAAFAGRRFDDAEAGFRRVLDRKPGDGPSLFYLAQITHCRTHPPPEGWRGEIELTQK